jgi:hypothetical protein
VRSLVIIHWSLVGPVSAAIGERMKDIKMVIYLSTSLPPQAFICPKGAIPLFQNSNIPTFQLRSEA